MVHCEELTVLVLSVTHTAQSGAGVKAENHATLVMAHCDLSDNNATWGAGIAVTNHSAVNLTAVRFRRNSANYSNPDLPDAELSDLQKAVYAELDGQQQQSGDHQKVSACSLEGSFRSIPTL